MQQCKNLYLVPLVAIVVTLAGAQSDNPYSPAWKMSTTVQSGAGPTKFVVEANCDKKQGVQFEIHYAVTPGVNPALHLPLTLSLDGTLIARFRSGTDSVSLTFPRRTPGDELREAQSDWRTDPATQIPNMYAILLDQSGMEKVVVADRILHADTVLIAFPLGKGDPPVLVIHPQEEPFHTFAAKCINAFVLPDVHV